MLPSPHRLRESADFRAAGRGARVSGRNLVVHLLTTDAESPTRVGFVVSKAVGQAVTRNRIKRRLRAVMAGLLDTVPSGALVVVRAKPGAATTDFATLRAETTELVEAAVARRRARTVRRSFDSSARP